MLGRTREHKHNTQTQHAKHNTQNTTRKTNNTTPKQRHQQLLRYPIPLAYTRHTSRFLFVWLTALPFALFNAGLGW